ncbi:hypothetical protein M378DRAFT_181466 [Amanita muscaria Koide BX008]|uniref:Uncharacterized protein n=1 Tax=Amanita muscaria (strain Koide BX008) TaxID=946122 RepID=A0A0C2WMP5_AMAMK|nr:hypothetical protein M378DRAFT_181466 [Amanita muscaria Koide BX008]
MSSPAPTPASALPAGHLSANSSAFVTGGAAPHKKVVLKNEDGIEVNLETLMTKAPPTPPPTPLVTARQYLPATPTKKTALIHIETPEQQEAVGGGRTEGERSQSQGGGGGRGAKNGRRRMETKEEEEKERLKKRRNA